MTPRRYRLLSIYRTLRFRMGQRLECLVQGDVVVVGVTDGRIQWPLGRKEGDRGNSSLVVYGDLARAIRREGNQAVCYWFGITPQTVSKWRKVLGVPHSTEATSLRLRELALSPNGKRARKLAVAKVRDPERRAKIAASRLGKPRPAHVIEKQRKKLQGFKHSDASKRKMSEERKQRGVRPPKAGRPWAAWEDELLRTAGTAEVVKRTGRTLTAVYSRRTMLGLPDGRTKAARLKRDTN